MRIAIAILVLALGALSAPPAAADRTRFVELAKRGWHYELRTTMLGRDLSIPVRISGRALAGSSLCVVGEAPHPASLAVIDTFRDLARHVFGKPLTMRYAGPDARFCGSGRTVILRLYSGFPPNGDLARDLDWMDRTYALGLPRRRAVAAGSPAMAQTFFGRRGQSTHIMVKQPGPVRMDALQALFYKSILIEELFQSFTFGMDILQFDRSETVLSKLQELPFDPRRRNWESAEFMRALAGSNPPGLCPFDVFMLHAVAAAPVDQTNEPGFIAFIEAEYDALWARAAATMAEARFAPILDPECRRPVL